MTDRPNQSPREAPQAREAAGKPACSSSRGGSHKRPQFTAAQRLKVFEMFGAVVCCQGTDCENVMQIKGCAIDHHLALVDGGKHEPENWRPLCPQCHVPKSAREHRNNAKAKRIAAERALHRAVMAGEAERQVSRMRSRGFDKTKTRKFDGTVVSRG